MTSTLPIRNLFSCILAMAGLLAMAAAMAQAATQPRAELLFPSDQAYFSPSDQLIIQLPTELPNLEKGQLRIELDNIDITAVSSIGPRRLRFKPIQALKKGQHELRVVYYGINGSIIELGLWTFTVRADRYFDAAELQGQLDVEVRNRVWEHDRDSGDQQTIIGGGQYSVSLQRNSPAGNSNGLPTTADHNQTWSIDGQWGVSYAHDPAQSLTGKQADIPYFYLSSNTKHTAFHFGDHALFAPSLINDGYQKRGISSQIKVPAFNASITVYGHAAGQEVGLEGGLGIEDSDNRVTGAHMQMFPIASDGTQLSISAEYLQGKKNRLDAGTVTSTAFTFAGTEGTAYNAVIDGQFFEKQLRVRYEYAGSEYDFDGDNMGADAEQDHAWAALITYGPNNVDNASSFDWQIGAEAETVGTYFNSLNNLAAPSDKQRWRTFANITFTEWYWDTAYGVEENNIINDASFAVTETQQWIINGGWQGQASEQPHPLFGQPTYSWSAEYLALEDQSTPVGFIANDMATETLRVNANFTHTTWQWSLGGVITDLQDDSGWQPNSTTNELLFDVNRQLSEFWHLGFSWQGQRLDYQDFDADGTRQLFAVHCQSEWIKNTLFATFNLNFNRNDAVDDPFYALRDRSTYVTGDLSWRIKEPKNNTLGFDMSLSVLMDDYFDHINPLNDTRGYQVFLTFKSSLPSSVSGG